MKHKTVTRTCVGCRKAVPKEELLRIVKTPEGEIKADPAHRLPGRGAYVHADAECIQRAKKSKGLDRSFRCRVPEQIYEELTEETAG